jgi:glutamine synthetase
MSGSGSSSAGSGLANAWRQRLGRATGVAAWATRRRPRSGEVNEDLRAGAESDAERFPHSLREAIAALEAGSIAQSASGDEVIDHYLNYAQTEERLFDEVVTRYEGERIFERG